MRLSDVELLQLLPTFMRQDGASIGLSHGTDQVIRQVSGQLPLLRKWDQIDEMDHEMLDELAWELNVLWYSPSASLETKRRLIKNSDMVYMRLGTRWAVEEVIQSYLGDATMQEFWEYDGGKPHYFRIQSNNNQITGELEEIFLWALDIVKRKSQWLEAITIELGSSMESYSAAAVHDVAVETVRMVRYAENMNPPPMTSYAGPATHDAAQEQIRIVRDFPSIDPDSFAIATGVGYAEASTETHLMKGGES